MIEPPVPAPTLLRPTPASSRASQALSSAEGAQLEATHPRHHTPRSRASSGPRSGVSYLRESHILRVVITNSCHGWMHRHQASSPISTVQRPKYSSLRPKRHPLAKFGSLRFHRRELLGEVQHRILIRESPHVANSDMLSMKATTGVGALARRQRTGLRGRRTPLLDGRKSLLARPAQTHDVQDRAPPERVRPHTAALAAGG